MRIHAILIFFAFILFREGQAQHEMALEQWETHQVNESITWKYCHFDSLFGAKQSITVLEVDLKKGVEAKIADLDSGLAVLPVFAEAENAVAAVNGSFFSKTGESTTFFKKDNTILFHSREWLPEYRENAGFAISPSGKVSMVRKPAEGWGMLKKRRYQNLLTSGPLLLYDGKLIDQANEKFNTSRHPRTAIGLTDDDRLIAVVVDGRSSNAYGMTTTELAKVMKALKCEAAMNLDGGGSSTVWVQDIGIVNYPSDNKKWDHQGARKIANAIVFVRER